MTNQVPLSQRYWDARPTYVVVRLKLIPCLWKALPIWLGILVCYHTSWTNETISHFSLASVHKENVRFEKGNKEGRNAYGYLDSSDGGTYPNLLLLVSPIDNLKNEKGQATKVESPRTSWILCLFELPSIIKGLHIILATMFDSISSC